MSIYNTYLDSLVFDSPNETVQTEKDIADELDLWGNAQFTFDVAPGVGIGNEEKKNELQGLDTATYESLVNYLDYELPTRPEVNKLQQQQQPRILPRPLAPAVHTLMPAPVLTPVINAVPTPVINPVPVPSASTRKRVREVEQQEEEQTTISPEEDKRRRNTAASARFRIKKKLREQAMEQSVQEMTNKSEKLQERVNQLEAEVKFLRELLLEKK